VSNLLRVVFDTVTRKASYRFAPLERPSAGLLIPPGLSSLPASVICSRPESLLVSDDDGANPGLVPEPDRDVSHRDISEPIVAESFAAIPHLKDPGAGLTDVRHMTTKCCALH
jgi:hypothetical protein